MSTKPPRPVFVYVLSTFAMASGWPTVTTHNIYATVKAAKKAAVESHGAALKWVERSTFGLSMEQQHYAKHHRGGWYCITRRVLYY